MRILSRAICFSVALFTSTLCEEHIHANAHRRRGLSELLNELATAEPVGKNAALASQLQAVRTAETVQSGGGVVTYILGGNAAKSTSFPINKGAIWVSISPTGLEAIPSPGAAQAAPTSTATGNPAQPSSSAQEPTSTSRSTPSEGTAPSNGTTIPVKGTTPGQAARPVESLSTTTMTETKTLWSTVVMASPSVAAPPPAALVPGVLPPSPVREGMTMGTGVIENGACKCACNCPANVFPIAQRPVLPPPVATTLSTVILPPTAPVALPSTLLVDTQLPPNGALQTAPIANPVATIPSAAAPVISAPAPVISASAPIISTSAAALPTITSIPAVVPPVAVVSTTSVTPSSSQPLPVVLPSLTTTSAPPPTTIPTTAASTVPESSIQLGLVSDVAPLPTAIAELAQPEASSINIATFSLVSSLVLGPLGV